MAHFVSGIYNRQNREWSDRFLPQIKQLVGPHLLNDAPDQHDWHEAADLMMLDARDLRVAARVRRPGYIDQHPYELTIRSRVPSGAETELSKIVNGHGDWLFDGHASASGDGFGLWWLIDLRAFRSALIRRRSHECRLHCGDRRNPDGTWFKWFDVRSFPAEPPLVVAAHSAQAC